MMIRPSQARELYNLAVAAKPAHKARCYREQAEPMTVNPRSAPWMQKLMVRLVGLFPTVEAAEKAMHEAWDEMTNRDVARLNMVQTAVLHAEREHAAVWKQIEAMIQEAEAGGSVTVPGVALFRLGVNTPKVLFEGTAA